MGRRRRDKKVTTVWQGLFGEKHVETRWVPDNSGYTAVVVIFLLIWLIRGC